MNSYDYFVFSLSHWNTALLHTAGTQGWKSYKYIKFDQIRDISVSLSVLTGEKVSEWSNLWLFVASPVQFLANWHLCCNSLIRIHFSLHSSYHRRRLPVKRQICFSRWSLRLYFPHILASHHNVLEVVSLSLVWLLVHLFLGLLKNVKRTFPLYQKKRNYKY